MKKKMNLAKLSQNEFKKSEMKETVAGIVEPRCSAWCVCGCLSAIVSGVGDFNGECSIANERWGI